MKIALIGATGFVGSAILQEALNRGHEVTAIVRDPEKLPAHPKLHPQKGDVYNEEEVARLVVGHDAVTSAPCLYSAGNPGRSTDWTPGLTSKLPAPPTNSRRLMPAFFTPLMMARVPLTC